MLATGGFNTAHHVHRIGVGDIGEDQADQAGLAALQAACHLAWPVVELLNGLFDALFEIVGKQVLFTIQIARHAGLAGFGDACHIADGGAS